MNYSETISEGVTKIKQLEKDHLQIGCKMLDAYGGAIYPVDLVAMGVLNRSLSQCVGFRKLIYLRNYICAASLVRLQMDTALRFSAFTMVDKPHEFAYKVMDGLPIKKLKDRKGKFLTDRYLVEQLTKKYDWIDRVYQQTSGYIHLSEKHIFNSYQGFIDEKLMANMVITAKQDYIPKESFIEIIDAFIACTKITFEYLNGWIYSKSNPEIIQKIASNIKRKVASDFTKNS